LSHRNIPARSELRNSPTIYATCVRQYATKRKLKTEYLALQKSANVKDARKDKSPCLASPKPATPSSNNSGTVVRRSPGTTTGRFAGNAKSDLTNAPSSRARTFAFPAPSIATTATGALSAYRHQRLQYSVRPRHYKKLVSPLWTITSSLAIHKP
jgi:hypothetical protein